VTDRSAASSEACSVVMHTAYEGGQEGAGPVTQRRRPGKASESSERASRNPPAYWAWTGQKVVLGTGGAPGLGFYAEYRADGSGGATYDPAVMVRS
jgi:hypothetical protein